MGHSGLPYLLHKTPKENPKNLSLAYLARKKLVFLHTHTCAIESENERNFAQFATVILQTGWLKLQVHLWVWVCTGGGGHRLVIGEQTCCDSVGRSPRGGLPRARRLVLYRTCGRFCLDLWTLFVVDMTLKILKFTSSKFAYFLLCKKILIIRKKS